MPTNKKPTINIDLVLSNYQAYRKEVIDAIGQAGKLKSQFQGVSVGDGLLEKQLSHINKVISILTAKVTKDGKMSITTAKELQDELAKVYEFSTQLEHTESKRLSTKEFKARFNNLKEETKALSEQLKTQRELIEAQEKIVKQNSDIRSFYKDKNTSSGIKNILDSGLDNKAIRKEVSGKMTDKKLEKLSANYGLTKDEVNELAKSFITMDQNVASASEKLEGLNSKLSDLVNQANTKQNAIKELLATGVSTDTVSNEVVNQTQQFSGSITQLVDNARKAKENMITLSDATEKTSSTFQEATKAIISSRVVMRTLRTIVNEAVRTIKEMDKALTGMTAVTGKSREEVLKLVPTLKQLAQETSSTMTDVSNLTTEYLRQGRSMQDALELAKETAKAAQIAEISTAESLTYMTSAINGFNLAASDASRVSDVFANVAAKTATDYEQLAISLSKVSAQANLAGMSLEFTTALLAKGIETTQEAPESIGTALKTIVARMRELTDYNKVLEDGVTINKVERALAAAGIQLRDTTGQFRDLEVIFNELGPKWDYLNTMQQQAIAQAVAGTRQQSRFVAIMQDWNRTLEAVDMAQNSAGASAYQYSKMAEGLNAKITNLTTSWQGFTTSLVDTEFVITILEGVTGTLNALTKLNSFIKTIGVTALAIVAYNKVSNFLADQKYRKNLEALALEEQVGDEARKNAIYNGRTLQEQIIKQKAKNTLLQQEIELLKKKKIALEKNAAEQKAKTGRNPRNYKKKREDLDTQIKDKQGELTQGQEDLENMEKTTGNILVKKLAILKTDMGILFAGKKSLTDAQKKHMVENKSLLTSLKLLMTDKSKLVANEAELTLEEAQLLVMKEQAAASLATLGYALLIVAALAAVTAVVVGIVSEFKAIENSQKKIQENNNKIYELNNTKNSLQDLVDEYDQLDKKVNKTAEDLERMKELESSMREIDGVTGVSSAKERIQDIDAEIYSAQLDNLKSTLKAFMAEGSKILDFSEFTDTLNQVTDKLIASRLEYLREIKQLTADEEASAKRISDTVTQGINYSAVMSLAQQQAYASKSGGERWANAGRLILGGGPSIDTIGSLITGNSDWSLWNKDTGFGKVMSWITNPVGQAFGLITKNQNAKQAAAYTQQIISEVTTDLANFSTDMAKITSEGFAAQYKLYQEALSSYKGVSREAIQEQYKFLEIYSGEIGTYADKIVENLQIDPTTLNELVSLYYSAGEDAAKSFIEGVYNASQNGKVEDAITISLKELYNPNSAARKDLEKTWQQQYKNELAKYEDYINLDPVQDERKLRKQAAALGWSETDPYIILNKMKTKYTEVGTAEQFINKQLGETKNKLLSLISPYEDSLSAIQAAQALSSKNENVKKYIETALNGGLTPENLQDILSDSAYDSVKEELVQAFIAGDMAKVASLLSTGVSGNVSEYTEVFGGRLNRLKSDLEIATDETQINALKEEIALIESIIANQGQLNEKKLNAIVYDKKLSSLQKDIESGAKGSAEALEKFLNAEIAVNKELIKTSVKNAGFTNVEEITKYLEQLYDGTLTWEEFSKATINWSNAQKVTFTELYELTKDYFKKNEDMTKTIAEGYEDAIKNQISLQDEVINAYKKQLQSEQEELQKSLDKRRDMYEKYFDALDRESSTNDFQTEQARLQRAIAALSTSTDAASLQKLKEYQQELSDLEKNQLDDERAMRKDAVMEALDNQEELMNQYYDDRMANEQQLWEEITKMSDESILSMMTTYDEEFKKSTDLAKSNMLSSFSSVIAEVTGMIHGKDSTQYADAIAQANKYSAANISYGYGSTASPVATSTSSTTETNNSSSLSIGDININVNGGSNISTKDLADQIMEGITNVIYQKGYNPSKS